MSTFHILLIKPSHYDDEGYLLQWWRSLVPANSLACLYGLADACRTGQVLGPEVEIQVHAMDECSRRIRPEQWLERFRREGSRALVALVGVQSNQFPRALHLARAFRHPGVSVCMGGFHVSGSLAMGAQFPPELAEAQALGMSLFAGEAEAGRFEQVVRDAHAGRLSPMYNFLAEPPSLGGEPVPIMDRKTLRTYGLYSSFDLGRGCPFTCSFCTVINVQGRKSRFREADDLERVVRANHAKGINRFFVTDDNLARNRNWEALFDRLIRLREEGIQVRLLAQVDVNSHRVPGFIEKAIEAGLDQIFIGVESINPENLKSVGKKQNKVHEYREALLAWKRHPVVITAGYIIGFPDDTPESVRRDVEIIKRQLPVDVVYFSYLTPLPGSVDHQRLQQDGAWMDPDLNKFDLNHRVTHHVAMSDEAWERCYTEAWESFYTFDHMTRVLRRMVALGSNKKLTTVNRLLIYREFRRQFGIHPLEGGLVRLRSRRDRRPELGLESPWVFYPRYAWELVSTTAKAVVTYVRLRRILARILRDPNRAAYRDEAIVDPAS